MNEQSGHASKRQGLARFFSKGNPALVAITGDRIRQAGKITFAEFMEIAQYHPEYGYYNSPRERIGKQGDFITGPETHPVFGALIVRQLSRMWQLLGQPRVFDVVEMGAGPGSLCRDVLAYAQLVYPDFFSAMHYRIVESSADSVAKQKDLLRDSRLRPAGWYASLSQLPKKGVCGCFISNELVDAFPVHRVVNQGGEIKEVYVGLDAGELTDVVGEPSSPALVDYFRWIGVDLPAGCQGEVNLRAVDWMKGVALHVRRGFVITVDYGYPAIELYTPTRPRGTLLCYYKHTYVEDPYVRVGQQDITTHVDFTALVRAGEEQGLKPLLFTTQREFLLRLGLPEFLKALEQKGLAAMEYRANRQAMEELVQPDDLGRLKVLIQGKNVEAGSDALIPPPLETANVEVPLLRP